MNDKIYLIAVVIIIILIVGVTNLIVKSIRNKKRKIKTKEKMKFCIRENPKNGRFRK